MSSERQLPRSVKSARNLLGEMLERKRGGSRERLEKPSDSHASLTPGRKCYRWQCNCKFGQTFRPEEPRTSHRKACLRILLCLVTTGAARGCGPVEKLGEGFQSTALGPWSIAFLAVGDLGALLMTAILLHSHFLL